MRSSIYSHMAAFVPCNKEALLKRLKKLTLNIQVRALPDTQPTHTACVRVLISSEEARLCRRRRLYTQLWTVTYEDQGAEYGWSETSWLTLEKFNPQFGSSNTRTRESVERKLLLQSCTRRKMLTKCLSKLVTKVKFSETNHSSLQKSAPLHHPVVSSGTTTGIGSV